MSSETVDEDALQGRIPVWSGLSYQHREKIVDYGLNALVVLSILVIAFPIYWTFRTSLTPQGVIRSDPQPIIPLELTLEHYLLVANDPSFRRFFFNTLLVSTGVVVLTVLTSTLGGYGLTRFDLPYKKTFARGILFGYMFPGILLAIPMFVLWSQIGMIDSLVGVMFALTAITVPFSLWLMWNFFQTIPISLEEAAQACGATRFEAFYQIALPMAKPGITAVSVFSFAIAWGAFTIPTVILVDDANWVLTIGIDFYVQQHTVLWGQIMAVCALMMIPPFLFVFFMQKALLRGFRVEGM